MKTSRFALGLLLLSFATASLGVAAPVVENWENNCLKCHGADGKGETKAGRKLKVKDYTDAAVQAKMTDADMVKTIVEGVMGDDGKEKMKAYKEILTTEEITEIVAYIRKMKS